MQGVGYESDTPQINFAQLSFSQPSQSEDALLDQGDQTQVYGNQVVPLPNGGVQSQAYGNQGLLDGGLLDEEGQFQAYGNQGLLDEEGQFQTYGNQEDPLQLEVNEIHGENIPKQIPQRIGNALDNCLDLGSESGKKSYSMARLTQVFQDPTRRPQIAFVFLSGEYMRVVQQAKKKKRIKRIDKTNSQRNLIKNFHNLQAAFIQGGYPNNSTLIRQFGSQMSFEKQNPKTFPRK